MTIEREEFGAKSANLAAIAPLISEIDAGDTAGVVGIPDFKAMSVTLHERWMNRDIIGADLMGLFEDAQELSKTGDGVMVRSSAVLGEDGENSMGAGVYESVRLYPNFRFVDFLEALKTVYGSVKSPKAIAYLEQLGINPDDERMGILLQTYPKGAETHFTLDTSLAGNSELILVRTEDLTVDKDVYRHETSKIGLMHTKHGSAVLDRGRVAAMGKLNTTIHSEYLDDIYHIVPDKRKFSMTHSPIALAKIALSIEEFSGSSVQVEAVDARKSGMSERDGWRRLWIVQNRPLARSPESPEQFDGFPESDEMPAFLGRGIGVLNGVIASEAPNAFGLGPSPEEYLANLDSLPDGERRLILFKESLSGAGSADRLTKDLLELSDEARKKIVVLVEEWSKPGAYSGAMGGHFETMCLELGIPCVFYDPDVDHSAHSYTGMYTLGTDQKYKIFSNGYQAQVYRA